MSDNQAGCAHRTVSFRTEPVDDTGLVRGYWECDSGCGAKFWPIPHPAPVVFVPLPEKERTEAWAQLMVVYDELLEEMGREQELSTIEPRPMEIDVLQAKLDALMYAIQLLNPPTPTAAVVVLTGDEESVHAALGSLGAAGPVENTTHPHKE